MVQIESVPQIPEELKVAAKAGNLVPFIGAGVSKLAGSPGWDEFANATIKFFVSENKYNLGQFEQLKHLSPRIKLSIAKSLAKEHNVEIPYEMILHPRGNSEQQIGEELYGYLSMLAKTFVTTNYDNWLSMEYPSPELSVKEESEHGKTSPLQRRDQIYQPTSFTIDHLQPSTVLHLHGSLKSPESMILTTEDYIRHYSNDRGGQENIVLTFLENLFNLKNILFIGYGLDELEVLEYIIKKTPRKKNPNERRHFILQGFFTHEQVLANAMEDYYARECGVQLLPFSRDQKDYMQLLEVIRSFADSIPIKDPLVVQDLAEMDALLDG